MWEESGGVSYSLNVAYLARYRISAVKDVIKYFTAFFCFKIVFSYFPPLKPRCILWSEKYGSFLGKTILIARICQCIWCKFFHHDYFHHGDDVTEGRVLKRGTEPALVCFSNVLSRILMVLLPNLCLHTCYCHHIDNTFPLTLWTFPKPSNEGLTFRSSLRQENVDQEFIQAASFIPVGWVSTKGTKTSPWKAKESEDNLRMHSSLHSFHEVTWATNNCPERTYEIWTVAYCI